MQELSDYQELNPLQRGKLFKRIKEDYDLSYEQLAKKIDKSASYVANSVRLINLPIAIKDGLIGGVISEGHARALASLNIPQEAIAVYKEVLKNHANVRDTEELVKEKKSDEKKRKEISQDQATKIKESIEKILGSQVRKIESKSSATKIELKIFLNH